MWLDFWEEKVGFQLCCSVCFVPPGELRWWLCMWSHSEQTRSHASKCHIWGLLQHWTWDSRISSLHPELRAVRCGPNSSRLLLWKQQYSCFISFKYSSIFCKLCFCVYIAISTSTYIHLNDLYPLSVFFVQFNSFSCPVLLLTHLNVLVMGSIKSSYPYKW